MADVIRKGIEAAEHDLVQDSNDILMEEVVLFDLSQVLYTGKNAPVGHA